MQRHTAKRIVYTGWRNPHWVNFVEFAPTALTKDRAKLDAIDTGRALARARNAIHVVLHKDGSVATFQPCSTANQSLRSVRSRTG
jgi:hypothetical protein